jgi:hypothetical protein
MKFQHPAFEPFRTLIDDLALHHCFPARQNLSALASQLGIVNTRKMPLRFIAPDGRLSARDYESHILQTGGVPTRPDNWHDLMNALVWLRFPRFKAALNDAHVQAMAQETGSVRGQRRDALTVLDESGVWVISQDPALPALLVQRQWHELFWEKRERVRLHMRFVIVGHALLEKALNPFPAMTGKCLLLNSTNIDPRHPDLHRADELASAALIDIESPRQLPPLPVLGVPGWDAANNKAECYHNREIFRPSSPGAQPWEPLPAK